MPQQSHPGLISLSSWSALRHNLLFLSRCEAKELCVIQNPLPCRLLCNAPLQHGDYYSRQSSRVKPGQRRFQKGVKGVIGQGRRKWITVKSCTMLLIPQSGAGRDTRPPGKLNRVIWRRTGTHFYELKSVQTKRGIGGHGCSIARDDVSSGILFFLSFSLVRVVYTAYLGR